jgi:hypothetical protein
MKQTRASAPAADHLLQRKEEQAQQLRAMIAEFDSTVSGISERIAAEERRTRNPDPAHYAYSTLAADLRRRRDKITASAADARAFLDRVETEIAGMRSGTVTEPLAAA